MAQKSLQYSIPGPQRRRTLYKLWGWTGSRNLSPLYHSQWFNRSSIDVQDFFQFTTKYNNDFLNSHSLHLNLTEPRENVGPSHKALSTFKLNSRNRQDIMSRQPWDAEDKLSKFQRTAHVKGQSCMRTEMLYRNVWMDWASACTLLIQCNRHRPSDKSF